MFSKFKVTSVSSGFTTHVPLIEVYEAEIRRLRGENEFLRHQNNSLVVLLNDAQERKKASFNASQKRFFESDKGSQKQQKEEDKKPCGTIAKRTPRVCSHRGMFVFTLFHILCCYTVRVTD